MNDAHRVISVVPDAGCSVLGVPVQAMGVSDVATRPDFVWELHGLGVRATATRLHILELLHREQGRWMRAEEVYQALLGAHGGEALPSIYRNLKDLERAGLLLRTWEEGRRSVHAVYQLRGDRTKNGAIVLVCQGCNTRFTAVDPALAEALRMQPDKAPGAPARPAAVRITCVNRHACSKPLR